jgi:hypothetical protein
MKSSLRFSVLRLLSFLVIAGASAACSAQADGGAAPSGSSTSSSEPTSPGTATTDPGSTGAAARAIAEADIVQLDGARLYAMSKSGTVSVVDVGTPGHLALLGQTKLPGRPFEMYRRGDALVAMSNDGVYSTGITTTPGTAAESDGGALVIALDVSDPTRLQTLATFAVPGEIADSRIVGDALYLATYENARCYRCGPSPRTMVTTFDLTDIAAMRQVDQASFASDAPDGYNLPWGSAWKRSILATTERLYVGGHADIAPSDLNSGGQQEGIIDVLDVTDPHGKLRLGARIRVAGALLSRWQIDEQAGILRVVSQRGAGRTGNGIGMPEIDTFRIDSTDQFVPLGHTTMTLPRQEGLRTVRFDGDRAYAITYNQTDPLFTLDLSDPATPQQKGELFMPGFMFYLEPHGDRLIGLGVDRTDPNGSLNVSLFDVKDPWRPAMIERVAFGATGITEDFSILNFELPEDQDRIQKAFHVFDDGLVVVPFTSTVGYYGGGGCVNAQSGVQLVEWSSDTLTKRALLPLTGNPRRAFEKTGEMITVSDTNVRSFSLANRDIAQRTADLVIGDCVENVLPSSGSGGAVVPAGPAQPAQPPANPSQPTPIMDGRYTYHNPEACSVGATPGSHALAWPAGAFFALAISALARRSRRTDEKS